MDESEKVLELAMAREGKIKTGLISLGFGLFVGAVTYFIARKVTDSTLDGVEILLTEAYDVQMKYPL